MKFKLKENNKRVHSGTLTLFNQMVIYQGNNKKQGEIQVVGKAQWQST